MRMNPKKAMERSGPPTSKQNLLATSSGVIPCSSKWTGSPSVSLKVTNSPLQMVVWLHGFDHYCLRVDRFAWGFQHELNLNIVVVLGGRINVHGVLSPFDHRSKGGGRH